LPSARRRARISCWLVPVILPWLAGVAAAASLTVNIEGLPKELKDAVEAQVTLRNYASRDVTPAQVRRLFNNAENEIRGALEPYGYYNAQVASSLQTTDKGLTALFRVTPGEQVKVVSKKVVVEGEAADLPRVRRALRRFKPDEGEPLDHGVYEQSKSEVEAALLGSGFLKLQAIRKRVEVTRKTNTATIDLDWQSGPRMKFGPVHFSDSQFKPEFLERYIPWEPGSYYSPDQLLAFQQRLVDADYFATVAVQPDLQHAEGLDVPINVDVAPAKRTIYTAGAYVSTDTGPGVKFGVQRRWVTDSGHKFQADIDYAQRMQAISTSYRIPLPGPDDKSLNFGVTHRNENTDTSHSKSDRAAVNETRKWLWGFTRTVGLQYLAGTYQIGPEDRITHLLYGEATLTRKQAEDYFFPRRGWSLAFATRFAPGGLISDTSFSQLTADGKYIMPAGRRQRLLMRLSLGTMVVKDFDQMPPELRFFAGGDRSIRGFDYQEVGSTKEADVVNADGQTVTTKYVIGGTKLAVASVEFEHYFVRNWGAAVFVDGGDAWRGGDFNLNIGAGLGVRWRSPVGVVRLDVAKPVKSELADAIRFHITIGPDL
jgi:translocation and assembly module TamA